MIHPQTILEIGTFTGYSAICLAKGLTNDGILHTIEINDEREALINKYIKKSNNENKIRLYIGNALEIIPLMNETFDLVFIDAEKSEYLMYYKIIFDKIKKGGFIFVDNVLWSNKVIHTLESNDNSTKGILEFSKYISNDHRVERIILPLRDGLMLIRKK
jgi:predicted O-methyltransferase YrrM